MGGRRSGGRSSGSRSFGGRSSSRGRGGGSRSGGRIGRGGSFRSGGRGGGGSGGGFPGGILGIVLYCVIQGVQAVFIFVCMIVLFGMVALLFYAIAMIFSPSLESWFDDYWAVLMIVCGAFGFVVTVIVYIRFVIPWLIRHGFSISILKAVKGE